MRLATAAEMAELDRLASEEHGLPTARLMENAGRRVAEAAAALLGGTRGRTVFLLCGRGHNGGDGLVAARLLREAGALPRALVAAARGELRPAAAAALAAAEAAGVEVRTVAEGAALRDAFPPEPRCDLAVDALLGTGFVPPARGRAAEGIALLNELGAPVLAVDIPSGLSADHGRIEGPAVAATATVTFALAKPGLLLYPAARLVGRLWLADIGFPVGIEESLHLSHNLATPRDLRALLAPRDPDSHKGSFGRVLIVGGSSGMSGAPLLAARGALRAGAGLVTVALPASLAAPAAAGLPEAMRLPLPPDPSGTLDPDAVEAVLAAAGGMSCVALGPGLSVRPEAVAFLRALLPRLATPAVLDADALNAVAGRLDALAGQPAALVLTPHPGELARLLGVAVADVAADRLGAARAGARLAGAVVALKGARTVVASPSGEAWINTTGNPALAAAGTGDVLTGVIAAHLARGAGALEAAVAGAHLHGLAGDLAAAALGPWGVLASEVADRVPAAVRELARRSADAAPVPGGLSLLVP